MKLTCLFWSVLSPFLLFSQTNLLHTNPVASTILSGNYDATQYAASDIIPLDPAVLGMDLQARISADSLKSYLSHLSTYKNRNTGSDTISTINGIGAARRWVYAKFQDFSNAVDNRLVVSYFQFDQAICTIGQHRNIVAILPGSDTANDGVVLVEGHIDSRCEVLCDTACIANGVEDNATGTALVMELARVMSKYQYPQTIVFMVTIGEEQGLLGAGAYALYAQQQNIPIRAVLNNDVIGGIICGKTSSPPSCPGLNDIDSTSVRLFSAGSFNAKSKQLARFIKLQYKENILPAATVPMNVRIMSPEDRTGRGGDHIPFREKGYPAMRFTSANEHGDASVGTFYTDRQHSTRDVLGVDTDGNNMVDSFFVDFNYLQRNATINANAAAIAALGVPAPPDFTGIRSGTTLIVNFNPTLGTSESVRIALRTTSNDWDTVYTVTGGSSAMVPCNPTGALFVSLARVNTAGAESLFGTEKIISISGVQDGGSLEEKPNIQLFQNHPNPFDEATWISFWIEKLPDYQQASMLILDLQGKLIQKMPLTLKQGLNETLYTHGYGVQGTFVYALEIDGKRISSRQMIFAN